MGLFSTARDVFVDDVEVHGFRQQLKLKHGLWQFHRHHVAELPCGCS